MKNYIQKKKKRNEFKQLFWGCFREYDAQATRVAAQYEQFIERYRTEQVYGFCHGDCNQHNITFVGKELHVLHYEQLRYDMPVSDLAKFMRKILEKNQWEISLGLEMLDAYDQERTLSYAEKWQLYYRLAYPEKFWKIANHYNNSRKVWVSGRDIEKLSKMQTQEKQRKQFLEILFYLGR